MSKPATLTPVIKREITSDWSETFPSLGIYKPLWLLKRHGPLLMGVLLDRTRSNDIYIPKFHVHNLLSPSLSILLSLVFEVPDFRQKALPRKIKIAHHLEQYGEAAETLRGLVPDLDADLLSWPRIVELHAEFIQQKRDFAVAKYCHAIFRDVILLASWCGKLEYAQECLDASLSIMSAWTPPIDVVAWQDSIERQMHPESMRLTLAAELQRHKLSHVPQFELQETGDTKFITDTYRCVWLLETR
ncbi:MAG: hypothetical protein R3F15_13580 [Lysobacterales bacterium]